MPHSLMMVGEKITPRLLVADIYIYTDVDLVQGEGRDGPTLSWLLTTFIHTPHCTTNPFILFILFFSQSCIRIRFPQKVFSRHHGMGLVQKETSTGSVCWRGQVDGQRYSVCVFTRAWAVGAW